MTAVAIARAEATAAGSTSPERVNVATADPTSSADALSGPTDSNELVPNSA
jgi:hypothetical protein